MNLESENFLRTGSNFSISKLESPAGCSKNTESNAVSERTVKRIDHITKKKNGPMMKGQVPAGDTIGLSPIVQEQRLASCTQSNALLL